MITIEQRIKLLDAGYTPAQIAEWEQPTQPEQQPTQPTQPEQQPTQPAQPEQQPTQPTQPVQQPTQPTLDIAALVESNKQIMENVAKLRAAIQANAIANAVQPAGAGGQYTGETAIAEIIAPPRKDNK